MRALHSLPDEQPRSPVFAVASATVSAISAHPKPLPGATGKDILLVCTGAALALAGVSFVSARRRRSSGLPAMDPREMVEYYESGD